MSTVKANSHQVGQSATAANNFTLYQPATPDGTVRLGVGNAGATTADVITASSTGVTIPSVSSSNTFGFKNRIINGGMVIDQRNAGASVTVSGYGYTLDRFVANASQASKYTVQQNAGSVTPPVGFTKYLGVSSSSAYSVASGDYFMIGQAIEGQNVADLAWGTANAATITLSFKVYSSLTGTFGGSLTNSANNRSYPFSYAVSVANTWTAISVTIPGDTTGTWLTTNGIGIFVFFSLGMGSTRSGTGGAWAAGEYYSTTGATSVVGTNGATFYITGVQLEVGSQATSFDFRSYGTELALCQRYYEKTYDTSVVPGTSSNNGRIAPGSASDNGSNASAWWAFAVEKRAVPTITAYTSAGASGSWNYERAGASSTSTAVVESPGTRGSRIYLNVGATNVPVWIYGHAVAVAEL